jgi:RNA polymerase sigma factor (TIGR02999 family)
VGKDLDELTQLLDASGAGDQHAHEKLISLLYAELRPMAHRAMAGEAPGHTLSTTALVNEAYLRLFNGDSTYFKNRRYFFGAAGHAMRRVLVDHARRSAAQKHGAGRQRIEIGDVVAIPNIPYHDMLDLHHALDRLEQYDAVKSEIVHLKFFAGLTINEIARTLDHAPRWVDQQWAFARAWLRRELETPAAISPS